MARSMKADENEVFRAAITVQYPADPDASYEGYRVVREFTFYRGPHKDIGQARAALTREKNTHKNGYWRNPPIVLGHIERGKFTWEKVED